MGHLDKDKTANDVCNPTWLHLNHLVSYCAKSIPGLDADVGHESDSLFSAALSCNRQNCVFRLRKQ